MSYSSWIKEKLLSLIKEMDQYHWLFTRNAKKRFQSSQEMVIWRSGEIYYFHGGGITQG